MMRRNHLTLSPIAAVFGLILLGGCAVGPDYKRPEVTLPEAYSRTEEQAPTALVAPEWWRRYADPALDELVARAREHNVDLLAAVGAGDDNPEVVTVPPHRAASAARAFRPFRRKGLFFPLPPWRLSRDSSLAATIGACPPRNFPHHATAACRR